jgi:hypothetical protein
MDQYIILNKFIGNDLCNQKLKWILNIKFCFSDSPDLFGCSSVQVSPQLQSCDCKWISFYSQKYPCNIFGMSCYSEGIAVITTLNEWITIQFLQINIDDDGEPVIHNNCSQQIRQQKQVYLMKILFKKKLK